MRTGAWLTEARIRSYSIIMLAVMLAVFATMLVTRQGVLDWSGKPLGTDFSQVWIAGQSVLAGHPADPFDPARHAAAQQAVFGQPDAFYGWHYPPYFLAVAALLALMPYLLALVVWQCSSFAFYLAVMHRILPGGTALLAAAAFPAVFVNVGHGHNGFLTAGLLGGALLCLETQPLLAGALIALVAYKPQFGLVVPVALLAGGYWRTIASATVTLGAMTAETLWAWGLGPWRAFQASLNFTRTVVLEQGNTGWEKIQSTFAAMRMLGGSVGTAYAGQGVVTALTLAALFWQWRRGGDLRLRAAAVLAAALLTTPYCLDYDLMILGPALAFLVAYGMQSGFRPWHATALAAIWAVPLVARAAAQHAFVPLGLLSIALLFGLAMRQDVRVEADIVPV